MIKKVKNYYADLYSIFNSLQKYYVVSNHINISMTRIRDMMIFFRIKNNINISTIHHHIMISLEQNILDITSY